MSDPTKADAYTEEDLRKARVLLRDLGLVGDPHEDHDVRLILAFRAEARREALEPNAKTLLARQELAEATLSRIRYEAEQSEREACERIVCDKLAGFASVHPAALGALNAIITAFRERAK